MSKIWDMLKKEKVEWKTLGEVAVISKGKQFNKKDMLENGMYPVINGGILPSGYINIFNSQENTITVSQGGSSAGFVNFIKENFWLGAHAFSVVPNKDALKCCNYDYYCFNRFLFHILKMNQVKLQDSKVGAGIPSVSKDQLLNIEVPLTSRETQEKIVNILDKFTECTTNLCSELNKELELRIKQYEYYLNLLLSEEYLKKKYKLSELRHSTLGEVGIFTRGNGLQKKDFCENGFPVIHYGQIYTQYNFATRETVSHTNELVFNKLRKAKQHDILIATTSENFNDVGKCIVWLGDEEIGFSGDMYSYRTTENSKYIAYYFQTTYFQKQKEKKVTGTKLIRIHGDELAKFSIVLPPIEIQKEIVNILDKFHTIVHDLKIGLPREIELRQKQYEYYRDKLLSFDSCEG